MKRIVVVFLLLFLSSCATGAQKNSAAYWNNAGVKHMMDKKYSSAESDFNKAISINPQYAKAHNNLGRVYFRQGQYEKAVEPFKKAVELSPNSVGAMSNLVESYMELQRYEEVIDLCRRILKLDAYDAKIRFDLGVAYLMTEDIDAALQEYKVLRGHDAVLAKKLYDMIPQ